jgi:hypothetical protein
VALLVRDFRLEEGAQFPPVRSGELGRVVRVAMTRPWLYPLSVTVGTVAGPAVRRIGALAAAVISA